MTNEQWLVYLYGIWPDGGFSFLVSLWLIFSLLAIVFITVVPEEDFNEKIFLKVSNFSKTVWIALVFLILANLVPDKKTFVAIVATPSIVESYKKEGGKLYNMDKIIDKILEKTMKELTKGETEK